MSAPERAPEPEPEFPELSQPPEFFVARIRADWQDWTFGAHQAARRADAIEDLVALRRQYRDLSDEDLSELAASWRSDSASGPFFAFVAAEYDHAHAPAPAPAPAHLLSAPFAAAVLYELRDEAAEALAALVERWSEQRRFALQSGLRRMDVPPPRVALLLPHHHSALPPEAWNSLAALDLNDPGFDKTLLLWDTAAAHWMTRPLA